MLDEINARLKEIEKRLIELRGFFDVERKTRRIEELSRQMSEAGFWEDNEGSTKIIQELKNLKNSVEPFEKLAQKHKESVELTAILKEEDKDLVAHIDSDLIALQQELEKLEFKSLLSGKFDINSAILSINAGAGGTESCDWVGMLSRMYSRWAENKNYRVKTIDLLPGEEAGIKNITYLIEGEYAYGYLKAERGVHRLVRISPFDANKRRHTSFASVDVIPEIEEDVGLNIEEKDLRIDVYRSKGAGGQSVNTTDSAVRITHIPSGIVVQCQNERSQYQNKQVAMNILKARLYEEKLRQQEEAMQKQYAGEKKKIEWGSQIRSYVMHPYNMVKDHRTEHETGNVNAVMNGEIDEFIEKYLKSAKENKI
ncbi:MAG: peptide chain release factor 2 [Candidatus Omnitrophica bacterium]|nr:peptide chain release factor 2 [Candidatus Omnitrophota bacterium]MDD5237282.1 peptide chain release factor 2 [Candidatus Omnitrophota bacterium]MDD5610806.1 peptide chain release factor 2 [Candidatus Omnitrophota bacterium]